MSKVRMAVVGAGQFGRNHLRVLSASAAAELVAVVDADAARAEAAAKEFNCQALSLDQLPGKVDAAVIATPTTAHCAAGLPLLEAGIDLLIEKPLTPTLEEADQLIAAAAVGNRVLQVGHLERYNPGFIALEQQITSPLFFEIHRMSVFTPRSLDVDVVLDLMIHDIDLVLAMTKKMPEEIRAAGVSILSGKVDIANVRLAFEGGAVANMTASRVSTEKVRKLRLFQPSQYISLDYAKQEGNIFNVGVSAAGFPVAQIPGGKQIGYSQLPVKKDEPLKLELESFIDCVLTRRTPRVDGCEARKALEVSLEILARIEEHSQTVTQTLARSTP